MERGNPEVTKVQKAIYLYRDTVKLKKELYEKQCQLDWLTRELSLTEYDEWRRAVEDILITDGVKTPSEPPQTV